MHKKSSYYALASELYYSFPPCRVAVFGKMRPLEWQLLTWLGNVYMHIGKIQETDKSSNCGDQREAKKLKHQNEQRVEKTPNPVGSKSSKAERIDTRKQSGTCPDILRRGRKFADKEMMLSLIDQLGVREDERVTKKLQRQKQVEQRLERRRIKQQEKKSARRERIEKVKKVLRNKKRPKKETEKLETK
ncbi:2078_t:CDS:2 [Acaulospora morrowiae]|uniref:2078_t:CDS:1 n=1 Tax=Acaulospora morrowiae TaxID=94023 RepID=A0A9N8VA91_9GLOM|nr:2078_t:CDS:2 [Acaulospora morrowiae]